MALFEDVLKGSWGAALVGVGVALVAPTVLPAVGAALRPLAKSAIKGGVMLYDTVKESIARDLKRAQANGRPPLSPSGIGGTFKRLEPPTFAEGFHELYQVHPQSDGTFLVQPIEPA